LQFATAYDDQPTEALAQAGRIYDARRLRFVFTREPSQVPVSETSRSRITIYSKLQRLVLDKSLPRANCWLFFTEP